LVEIGHSESLAKISAKFPEKSDFLVEIVNHRYLNVVYKVPNKSCIIAVFPPDLHSSEVVSWDDLSRGNWEISCHKPFRYVG
jgi:hypothetical protein